MNEIEKQFYETFEIKPRCSTFLSINENGCTICNKCEECLGYEYPEITDRTLLELICILTAWHLDEREPYEITGYNITLLKNQVLQDCNSLKNIQKVKKKVQALFQENN